MTSFTVTLKKPTDVEAFLDIMQTFDSTIVVPKKKWTRRGENSSSSDEDLAHRREVARAYYHVHKEAILEKRKAARSGRPRGRPRKTPAPDED